MESKRNAKKRIGNKTVHENKTSDDNSTTTIISNTHESKKKTIYAENKNLIIERIQEKSIFKSWSFGTINIRSGKEREEGAKIYSVAKEVCNSGLLFCCLQEVKHLNTGKKLISLDNGKRYEFHWCGMKKKREAGVGILILVDPNIIVNEAEILDPRVMVFNLKIYGFNVRLVNVYSPTEVEASESKKDAFYRLLQKSCIKKEKHEKLIIAGDFNAKTSIALRQCFYDGRNYLLDDECNDNGSRLKAFCSKNRLCMASTFFDYDIKNRFTWYSFDKKTKKKNDYVLTESYVQQYISGCIAMPDIDLDSDHRILITSLDTPMTRKARKQKRKTKIKRQKDVKSLENSDIKSSFKQSLTRQIEAKNNLQQTNCEKSEKIVQSLHKAAEINLPFINFTPKSKEIWKEDIEFNELLERRKGFGRQSNEYKTLTKQSRKELFICET